MTSPAKPSTSAERKAAIERTLRQAQATRDAYEGEDSWLAAYREDVNWLLGQLEGMEGYIRGALNAGPTPDDVFHAYQQGRMEGRDG